MRRSQRSQTQVPDLCVRAATAKTIDAAKPAHHITSRGHKNILSAALRYGRHRLLHGQRCDLGSSSRDTHSGLQGIEHGLLRVGVSVGLRVQWHLDV